MDYTERENAPKAYIATGAQAQGRSIPRGLLTAREANMTPTLPQIISASEAVAVRLSQVQSRCTRISAHLGNFDAAGTMDRANATSPQQPTSSILHAITVTQDVQMITLDRIESVLSAIENVVGV